MFKKSAFVFAWVLFAINLSLFAQTWVKSDDGLNFAVADILKDNNNFLVLGNGDSGIFLSNLSESGNLTQTKYIIGESIFGSELIKTRDGNYIIVGDKFNESGNRDLLVIKISPFGEFLWGKSYDSGGLDTGWSSSIATSDNGFILTYFGDELSGVIKCNENGEIEWEKLFNWQRENYSFECVTEDGQGGFLIAFNGGDYTSALMKLSASGDIVWQKKIKSGKQFQIWDAKEDVDGILIGARVHDTSLSHGCSITKLDGEGRILWKKAFTNDFYYSGLPTFTKTSSSYIIGNSVKLSKESDNWDVWLMVVDKNMNIMAEKRFDIGQSSEGVIKVLENKDGGCLAYGYWKEDSNYHRVLMNLNQSLSLDYVCGIEKEISSRGSDFNLTISDMQPLASENLNFFVQDISVQLTDGDELSLTDLCSPSCPTIDISPSSLPSGRSGEAYNAVLTASGGSAPYKFSISSGNLPNSLSLSESGTISGTPSEGGDYNFSVSVVDASNCGGKRDYSLHIEIRSPSITSVSKLTDPFRLKITGSNFHSDLKVYIGGDTSPYTNVKYKSSSQIVLKGGSALKAKFPKGVAVEIKIVNGDGGEATFTYTR